MSRTDILTLSGSMGIIFYNRQRKNQQNVVLTSPSSAAANVPRFYGGHLNLLVFEKNRGDGGGLGEQAFLFVSDQRDRRIISIDSISDNGSTTFVSQMQRKTVSVTMEDNDQFEFIFGNDSPDYSDSGNTLPTNIPTYYGERSAGAMDRRISRTYRSK